MRLLMFFLLLVIISCKKDKEINLLMMYKIEELSAVNDSLQGALKICEANYEVMDELLNECNCLED